MAVLREVWANYRETHLSFPTSYLARLNYTHQNPVHHGLDMTLADGLFLEATLFGVCCATDDKNEGTKAFLEKRAAEFKGK